VKTAVPSRRDRICSQLADLKMPGALEALDDVLSQVDGGKLATPEAIESLLGAQISLRNNRRLRAAMRSSRLPAVKMLSDFDFTFQPSIKREQLDALHDLGFLERKENVIFLGPPGVGRIHLAISLAIAAAQSGRRVYYGTLADLITSLEEAQAASKLSHRLKTLTYPSLRARLDRADLEQELRGAGRDLWRRRHGCRAHRPPPAPLPRRQHPWHQLSHEAQCRALDRPQLTSRRGRRGPKAAAQDQGANRGRWLTTDPRRVRHFQPPFLGHFQPALTRSARGSRISLAAFHRCRGV